MLGPHAGNRGRLVREESEEPVGCREKKGRETGEEPVGRRRRWKKRKDWATVMRRTLGLDVLSCPECSGRMRVIATIEKPETAAKILRAMGLPAEAPEVMPSRLRPPPQSELDFVQTG